jgi:hypothetical protein
MCSVLQCEGGWLVRQDIFRVWLFIVIEVIMVISGYFRYFMVISVSYGYNFMVIEVISVTLWLLRLFQVIYGYFS